MEVQTSSYVVEMLTAEYQISGHFEPRGNAGVFLNDQEVHTLVIEDATLVPLTPGARVGSMPVKELFLPKGDVQVMVIDGFSPREASLMPKAIPLVCFTDTFVVRATFHAGSETQPQDVLSLPGPFLPATNVEIFTLRPLTVDIAGDADMIYIHKAAVRTFYPAE